MTGQPPGLYARILGADWGRVAEVVRRFHNIGSGLRASGTFQVVHSESRAAQLLARALGFPRAAEAVALQLEVLPQGSGERWLRQFGPDRLLSLQWAGPAGFLMERHGLAEFRFRLQVVEGALTYQTDRLALGRGPVRLPLPRSLALQVTASEAPGTTPNRVLTRVNISAPFVGLLLRYEGEVEFEL